MRIIGKGAFGKVRIVQHRESRQLYALKYISKQECIRMDAVRNVIRERTILEQLDHAFLCRLRFAFQDEKYMYMVSDLMLGGDLNYHLGRRDFGEDVIRIWFAELASAIKYLHCNGVVHRDIKPHNILLDDKGHAHLTDFNIATYLNPRKPLTSTSGTGYYIAPEVYRVGGYNEAVDWWSLGVTLYECVYKKRPFDYSSSEELKNAIRRGYVHYPNNDVVVSGECLAAMQGFLEVNPSKRLGQGNAGWSALVRHPFFRSVDWQHLDSKTIHPPFQVSGKENNFDLSRDIEDILLGGTSPSAHISMKMGAKANTSDNTAKWEREMKLIEEKFLPFDFTIFEKYEGFKDPVRMTVGDPPDWVKPAFKDTDQGELPPVSHVTSSTSQEWQDKDTLHSTQPTQKPRHRPVADVDYWKGLNKSASTSKLASAAAAAAAVERSRDDASWKRNSAGALYARRAPPTAESPTNGSATTLSEEYAMALQGVRKKQSTRSFQERRERDRKTVIAIH